MAFANGLTTFYLPTTPNAGASLRGTDVRKLLDSADSGSDATTQTSHGTGGATARELDPYTNNNGSLAVANYGWMVDATDMGATPTKKRIIFAGDHTATLRTTSNQVGGVSNFTLYAYRIGPAPSRTATLLGSQTGADFNYGVVPNAYRTETVTLNLPEIVLEDDETIQYSLACNSPGVVVVGRTNSHNTGTQGGVAIRIDHPGLGTLVETTGTAAGGSSASAQAANIMAANGSGSGTSAASASVGGIAGTTGESTGAATATAEVGAVSAATGAASGSSQATAATALIKATVGTSEVGSGGSAPIYRRTTILLADD